MTEIQQIRPDLVQEFVGNCHGGYERVLELLNEEPMLLNASWDWGGGDWETGLGAAAHMGRRDIAELLISRGARIDIFAAAMLGHLEVVKAIVAVNPEAMTALGPHGIPLIDHARAGGQPALEVLSILTR